MVEKVKRVDYSSNNSGGTWWLNDKNWFDLEKAGWKVEWIKDDPFYGGEERFLGTLAQRATRFGLTLKKAIKEWERITGLNSEEEGCDTCGQPHYFYFIETTETKRSDN